MIHSETNKNTLYRAKVEIGGNAESVLLEFFSIIIAMMENETLTAICNAAIAESLDMLSESLNNCDPNMIAQMIETLENVRKGFECDEC